MFDSIINEARKKFNLGNKAENLISALLALMTDTTRGGFAGFLDRFNQAGLGDLVSSWIGSDSNTPISNEQVESALGEENLRDVANQSGLDYATATSATAMVLPRLIDNLTPDGEVPDEASLLTGIGGYLGGATAATGAFDRVGNATEDALGTRHDMMHRADAPVDGFDDDSPLKWIIPLLLLVLLVIMGFWFCGKSKEAENPAAPVNTNANMMNAN